MDFSKRSREIDVESVARNGREIRNANCSRFDYYFRFFPKNTFHFLHSSLMRRWAISAAIYLSREEEASINTIINIKLRVVRGRFSIIFLKSYINFFSGYYILAQIIGAACFK